MKKILIIDDDQQILEFLENYLSFVFQAETKKAHSKNEGIEKIVQEFFDLIICDYEMPDGNGIEVLNYLKENKINSKFILFTGKDSLTDEEGGRYFYIVYEKNIEMLVKVIKHSTRLLP